MNAIRTSCLAVAAGVVVSFGGGLLLAEPTGRQGRPCRRRRWRRRDLAQGPYAPTHMLLQKTVLHVNVANIDVRFDKATQAQLAQIIDGKRTRRLSRRSWRRP